MTVARSPSKTYIQPNIATIMALNYKYYGLLLWNLLFWVSGVFALLVTTEQLQTK